MTSLKDIEAFCEKVTLQMWKERGEIKSHLIYLIRMDGQDGMVYMPYGDRDKGKTQSEALRLLNMMKIAGVFRAVCLVGEAWVSSIPKEKVALMEVMMPRHDPDRQECLFVSVFKENEKSFKGWEIKRDKDGKGTLLVMKDWDKSTQGNESWLDRAMFPLPEVPDDIRKQARTLLDQMLTEKGERIK